MIKLTHLEKLYWKKERISKGDLLTYYAQVAPYILPYLKNRPLVLHRFPEGIEGEAFFQKEAGPNLPSYVKTAAVVHNAKNVNYILVQNANTLLYAANLSSIEMHIFNSTIKHLEKPDYVVLDLDPEDISFEAVIETALTIHDILEELKVPHLCKTSGMSGLHIYIPLAAKYTYEIGREFAFLIATIAHQKLPQITSLERSPKKRQKKVYIDTLQNLKGQTLVAPYSVRAAPHAPVSTPLLWQEVKPGLDPLAFSMKAILKRLALKGDLFKPALEKGVNLKNLFKIIK